MKAIRNAALALMLILLALLISTMPPETAQASKSRQTVVTRLDTLETYTKYARDGNYFKAFQLMPVRLNSSVSARAEVKVYLSMDKTHWVLYRTLTDAVVAGVSDTLWYHETPPVPAIRFTASVMENDSVAIEPWVLEIQK